MEREIMDPRDTVSGVMAECWVIWDGKKYCFKEAVRLDSRFKKARGKDGRITGWKGTGRMAFHYNDSVFRRMMVRSRETGEDIYFDMQVANDDPPSRMGRQTVLLKGCCIESGTLAEFDAEADYLVEDMEFTFSDFEVLEKFRHQDEKTGPQEKGAEHK